MTAAETQRSSAVSVPLDTTVVAAGANWPHSPAVPARTTAPAGLPAAAAQLAPHIQYRIARLGVVGQAGLAALVAAAVLTASALVPAQRALQTLSADLARAGHAPVAASQEESAPRLLASLPARAQMPEVVGQILTQAKAAGVSLDTGHYVYTPAKGRAVARYELEFPVKAAYPDIRNFIDRTLSAVPVAALGKLRFERKAVGDPVVGADIVFVVFLRGAEQP